jgi:hypothetical protein
MQFQKVFAISMESRTDKRDTRTLAAALTGFDIEWLPGVAFEDVSEKAAPPVRMRQPPQHPLDHVS